MAIVKVIVKKHRKKNDGSFPIAIYVYEKKVQYVYTGYSIQEHQFKDGRVVKHTDAAIMNAAIEEKRREVLECIVPGVGYVEGGSAKTSNNLTQYIRHRAEQFKKQQQVETFFRYRNVANQMTEYFKRDVYFHEISLDWINDFVLYCKSQGNSHNTAMHKIKSLRTLYNQAAKEGLCSLPNPFNLIVLKMKKPEINRLTPEQIAGIERLPLERGSYIDLVRDAFLFSFYAQGMRFENVCTLTWPQIKDDDFKYQMNKGGAWRYINIHPKMRAIFYKLPRNGPYVFPFIKEVITGPADLRSKKGSVNTSVNSFLKIIGDMVKIPFPLKFHMARHSFAFQAKKKNVSTDVLKDALGHSNVIITERYLDRLADDDINSSVSVVWD
ncbi:hypothetical protein DCC81_24615 [Chitinophaga parva]|uniref:Tyr recombinase domain-containing protein n=1 Tax=Chitinophaga parva TaxID=2169414 RepID=A0A2T7BBK0_9BACT|nr:site-specific integrase [Chitinophaga parva]PUZ21774.1 hypothetical protein DCC81_24615 [Chitinophaga parva]